MTDWLAWKMWKMCSRKVKYRHEAKPERSASPQDARLRVQVLQRMASPVKHRECSGGVIGSRTSLRGWRDKTSCEFKSHPEHMVICKIHKHSSEESGPAPFRH